MNDAFKRQHGGRDRVALGLLRELFADPEHSSHFVMQGLSSLPVIMSFIVSGDSLVYGPTHLVRLLGFHREDIENQEASLEGLNRFTVPWALSNAWDEEEAGPQIANMGEGSDDEEEAWKWAMRYMPAQDRALAESTRILVQNTTAKLFHNYPEQVQNSQHEQEASDVDIEDGLDEELSLNHAIHANILSDTPPLRQPAQLQYQYPEDDPSYHDEEARARRQRILANAVETADDEEIDMTGDAYYFLHHPAPDTEQGE